MADKTVSLEKVKSILLSQYRDPAKYEHNKKLLRAVGIFGVAIILMKNFGDAMAV